MTSEPAEAFVWVWLHGAAEPVVAGRVWSEGDIVNFNYGRSYLEREEAIPLYLPELPLRSGAIPPARALSMPGCIADAMPDAWGRRVIMRHVLGRSAGAAKLGPLGFMLESGSDRIGALDFQSSPDAYEPRRGEVAPLAELMEAARRVDEGMPLTPELDRALLHGSSIGGARPKALLDDGGRKLIAKFSSSSDAELPAVKGEYVAMELARRAGLEAAPVELVSVMGRDVLLVERFDRPAGTAQRRALVSALTMLGLPEESRPEDWSYAELAQVVRRRFTEPKKTLRELFARIAFNILVGNTDDHPRNHAAFWDGEMLTLTPAYDVCPQRRGGGEAAQLMAIAPNGWRMSQLAGCVDAAAAYQLSGKEAREVVDRQIAVIESDWSEVCDAAGMSHAEREFFWRRQFLNPYAMQGYGAPPLPLVR